MIYAASRWAPLTDTMEGVTLVPVHGPFWHESMEICFNRMRFYGSGKHCWNDLLVIRRESRCVKEMLIENLTNTRARFAPACSGACML